VAVSSPERRDRSDEDDAGSLGQPGYESPGKQVGAEHIRREHLLELASISLSHGGYRFAPCCVYESSDIARAGSLDNRLDPIIGRDIGAHGLRGIVSGQARNRFLQWPVSSADGDHM